jgi:hypothetical protein
MFWHKILVTATPIHYFELGVTSIASVLWLYLQAAEASPFIYFLGSPSFATLPSQTEKKKDVP